MGPRGTHDASAEIIFIQIRDRDLASMVDVVDFMVVSETIKAA